MATKRMFYVNASNQNVGRKKNRRPLAQGRLVTSPTTQAANLPRLQQGIVQDTFHRLSVAADDLNVTPRRTIPHATEHQSPRPSPPAENLDLSDTEEGFVTQVDHGEFQHLPHSQPEVHHVPHVVVLDASAACASPHQVEVECVLGYERTPAQVICHSQQSFSKQSLSNIDRDEGFNHWKVQVSPVPRVGNKPATVRTHPVISPLRGNDKSVPGSTESLQQEGMESCEEIDTMVSRITRQEHTCSTKVAHVPHLEQPVSLASGKVLVNTEKPGLGRPVIPVNAASDSDSCSLFEYVPQNKNRSKISNDSQKLAPGSGKKKKGERIVASRYLQSAGSKKKSASAGPEKKVVQRPLNSTGGSYVAKASLTAKSKKPPNQNQHQLASSPNGADKMAMQEKTSTPTHGGAPVLLNTCDYSAISVDLSSVSMADASVLGGPFGGGYTSLQQAGQHHRGKDLSLLQQTCDQEYSHYLQVHYLSSLAQKCQADVQKEAMKQLSHLCNLMDVKQMEAAELDKELPRLQHLNQVHDLLEAQQGGLESVVQLLPAQQKEYRIFSTALDTTLHQIETRGILIPSSEEQYEAELANLLLETEELLGSIATMCKDSSAVQNVAIIFQDIQKAAETQRSDVLKCVELVSAMESLVTQETSLRIQEMQTSM